MLVMVLWIMAILTLLAASIAAESRSDSKLASLNVRRAQARAVAEAGMWIAVSRFRADTEAERWQPDGIPHQSSTEQGIATIVLTHEAGKVDLNTAREELLWSLLKSAGLPDQDADAMLAVILDWKDADDLTRAGGAEREEYERRGLDYGPKNAPFTSVEELGLVAGMTIGLFQAIAPALTIHSRLPGIAPEFAQRTALLALPGIDAGVVESFFAVTDWDPVQWRAALTSLISGVDSNMVSSPGDPVIEIDSVGAVAGSKVRLLVTVAIDEESGSGLRVLSWRENPPIPQGSAPRMKHG